MKGQNEFGYDNSGTPKNENAAVTTEKKYRAAKNNRALRKKINYYRLGKKCLIIQNILSIFLLFYKYRRGQCRSKLEIRMFSKNI
jgi:hypothetical protein